MNLATPIEAASVREMQFADLYLGHPTVGNRFSSVPKAPADPLIASPELKGDLDALYDACKDRLDRLKNRDFKIDFDGVNYRVAVMHALGGTVFVLRKMVSEIKTLAQTGLPQVYIKPLVETPMTGLFLITGSMNSGKTTTAGALIAERLQRHGGIAVTAEDPVELPLEGEHGKGVCFQTDAARQSGGFAEACRSLVRWGARIIYLGEIRDGETAVEALRAGVNGHLVISTLHAEDIQTGLRRLHAMSSEAFDAQSAQRLLADGLAGVIHQRLVGDPRRLEADMMMIHGNNAIQSMIREGKFERLASEINLERARMLQNLNVGLGR